MGSLDKRKMDIKRDLKRQKTEVTKAKKIAETLLLHLQEAQKRIDKTDMALDNISANVFDGAMTAIRKNKRDLNRQKTEVTKAKKIAETLLLRLQETQERIDKTDMALDTIPANVFDGAMTAIRKKKNLSNIKSQLEQLAHRVAAQSINLSFPPCSVKPASLPVDRQTRLVRRLTTKPVTTKPKGKTPKPPAAPVAPVPGSIKKTPLGLRPTSVPRPASISRPASSC